MAHLINLSNQDLDAEANFAGYDGYDAAGDKLGSIDGVIVDGDSLEPRYVVVDSGGWFTSKQFVVPAGDIREINDDDQRVYFRRLTKQTLDSGVYPRYDEHWWDTNAHAEFDRYEQDIAHAYQPDRPASDHVDYTADLYKRPAAGAQRLQLLEERLRAVAQREHAGTVRLGKRITEREETVEVPLREERVVIERQPGSGEVTGEAITDTDETIEVPVMKERAVVDKETVVRETVAARTETTARTERVQDTVRREELDVEGDGEVITEGENRNTPQTPDYERESTRRR
jgi:uncharacterized protein (TIGR02271 family)